MHVQVTNPISRSYLIIMLILIALQYVHKGIFLTSRYQGILKATVFGVFEDLNFKISEASDQN